MRRAAVHKAGCHVGSGTDVPDLRLGVVVNERDGGVGALIIVLFDDVLKAGEIRAQLLVGVGRVLIEMIAMTICTTLRALGLAAVFGGKAGREVGN